LEVEAEHRETVHRGLAHLAARLSVTLYSWHRGGVEAVVEDYLPALAAARLVEQELKSQ
jgi:hypothetical protein